MSAGQALVSNKLSDAYESLVARFQTSGELAGCGPVYYSSPPKGAFERGATVDEAKFQCVFYLKGWKWRGSSHSTDTIDMLIKVQETLLFKPVLHLKSSMVHVSYFETKNQTAHLRGCIHYDHQNPPQDRHHPYFHAQLYSDAVEPVGEIKAYFNYAVDSSNFHPFNHVRIPTADMTFGSVLLCLAADHLPEAIFIEFRKHFISLQDRLPHPVIDTFRSSFGLGANPQRPIHLKSLHWFAQ
jgi:hypothetical protein